MASDSSFVPGLLGHHGCATLSYAFLELHNTIIIN